MFFLACGIFVIAHCDRYNIWNALIKLRTKSPIFEISTPPPDIFITKLKINGISALNRFTHVISYLKAKNRKMLFCRSKFLKTSTKYVHESILPALPRLQSPKSVKSRGSLYLLCYGLCVEFLYVKLRTISVYAKHDRLKIF